MSLHFLYADSASFWQMNFQDPATPIMEGLINLHHYICFFLIVILCFVVYFIDNILIRDAIYPSILFSDLFKSFEEKYKSKGKVAVPKENIFAAMVLNRFLKTTKKTHDYLLEIIWTLIPSVILVVIAIPSFSLLYAMDEVISPSITLKVIGHQWYWAYEYSDYYLNFLSAENENNFVFDSYMVPEDELNVGDLRLLEVDNSVVLPIETHIRIIVTAGDVLHSWAVPSLGVKVDAVPGRLNQTSIYIKRPGVFYGQCSEICGVNHGFMPIVVEAMPLNDYIFWLTNKFNSDI